MVTFVPVCQPFSLQHALAFMSRFPACADESIIVADRATVAFAIDGKAHAVTLRGELAIDTADDAPSAELAKRGSELVGANDDLRAFYAAAKGDEPFAPIVRALHGLHHVRFIGGLAELAVYSVMMQRTPMQRAARMKRAFLDRFGLPVAVGGRTIRAAPELAVLAQLDAGDIGDAIGHRAKGERIAGVIRGVAALGEPFLREAPYAEARDALLEIPGVGPFAAGAILLRGLGRMDDVPSLDMFEREGRAVYGRAWAPKQIAHRYGAQIGYWSYYLKAGAAKRAAGAARSARA